MEINVNSAAVGGVAVETPQAPPVEPRRVVAMRGGPKAQGDPPSRREAPSHEGPDAREKPAQAGSNLESAIRKANSYLDNISQTSVRFRVDEDFGELLITVVDANTEKIVRQIPSEEMVKMAARMEELQGILLDKEA